jgi:hypothetical protein
MHHQNRQSKYKKSLLNCQAPTKQPIQVVSSGSYIDKKNNPDFHRGLKKFSAQFDLSAKSLQCGCMIKHNLQNQTTSLQNDCQAPTKQPIQVVSYGNYIDKKSPTFLGVGYEIKIRPSLSNGRKLISVINYQ